MLASSDLLVYGPVCPRTLCGGPKFSPGLSSTNSVARCPDDSRTYRCAFCVTTQTPAACAINSTDADGALVTGIVGIDQASVSGLRPAYVYYGQLTGYGDRNGNPVVVSGASGRIGLGYGKNGIYGLQSPLYIMQWVNNLPLGFSLCTSGPEAFIDMGEILATSSIYEWTPGTSPDYFACTKLCKRSLGR